MYFLDANGWQPLFDLLQTQGGVVAILAGILWTLNKAMWAPWWVIQDKDKQIAYWQRETDRWQTLALHGTNLASAAMGVPPIAPVAVPLAPLQAQSP